RNAGARPDAGHFAVAVTRVGIVLDPVVGQADRHVLAGLPLGADAAAENLLVVVLGAGVQVRAVAVALIAGDGGADAEIVRQRHAARGHQVDLVVAAIGAAQGQFRILAQAGSDVFHRATDGVAAVRRALRSAQDLNADRK